MKTLLFFVVLLLAAPLVAVTHYVALHGGHVPPFTGGWSTAATSVHAAVACSGTGDLILMATGVYDITETIVVTSGVTIAGTSEPAATVIDAHYQCRCVELRAPQAALQRLTLQCGQGGAGGGVLCHGSNLLVECILRDNRSAYWNDGQGAGVYMTASVISNCSVLDNIADYSGGGVYARSGSAIVGGTFSGNESQYGGDGGAVALVASSLDTCQISSNQTRGTGGGVYCVQGSLVRNAVIHHNVAIGTGSGAVCDGSSHIENCTIVYNDGWTSDDNAGVVAAGTDTVVNCIIWYNTSKNCAGTGYAYCCVPEYTAGLSNIIAAPVFSPGSFHVLHGTSPCINRGMNMAWMTSAADCAGNPRVVGIRPDIGAYEYAGLWCDFQADTTQTLRGLTRIFSADISGTNLAGLHIAWDVTGDGLSDATGTSVIAWAYATAGVYTASASISNGAGESWCATKTNYMQVLTPLCAAFDFTPRTAQTGHVVCFFDRSYDLPQCWLWNFGCDGMLDSTQQHPAPVFAATGVFTVTLTVSNNFGNGGSSWATTSALACLSIVPELVADFSVTPPTAHVAQVMTFADASAGHPCMWWWDFDADGVWDATTATAQFAYTTAGRKTVTLCVSNAYAVTSITKTNCVTIYGPTPTHYVALHGTHMAPYVSWATAATNIQAAVDVCDPADVVLVSDGVYCTSGAVPDGQSLPNRVCITNDIALCSVHGPAATLIEGYGVCGTDAVRGVYLSAGSVQGFTICAGATLNASDHAGDLCGGGVYAPPAAPVLVSNCIIVGNAAAGDGGGVCCAPLADCTLISNHAYCGGGAYAASMTCGVVAWNNAALAGGLLVGAGVTLDGVAVHDNRCDGIYVGEGAGGGVYCNGGGTVRGCTIMSNAASSHGGGVYAAANAPASVLVEDCVICVNTALYGAGVFSSGAVRIRQCAIMGNTGMAGAGIYLYQNSGVEDCLISGNRGRNGGGVSGEETMVTPLCNNRILENSAEELGGGALYVSLSNCVVAGNHASDGGGAAVCTLQQCLVTNNYAHSGGGLYQCTAYNCFLGANCAYASGGGAAVGTLVNCTIAWNRADSSAGGIANAVVRNCIICYNRAGANPNLDCTAEYSCATPVPDGTGNISTDPLLAGMLNPHVLALSPCRNAGANDYAMGVDIDGETRIADSIVDMGCDEVITAALTDALSVAIIANAGGALPGCPLAFTAQVDGRPLGLVWTLQDEAGPVVRSNLFAIAHTWYATGSYLVTLLAYNLHGSAQTSLVVQVCAGWTNYVAPTGQHVSPYLSWETAATNITAALAAGFSGGVTLVAPGTYRERQLTLTHAYTLAGTGGQHATILDGQGSGPGVVLDHPHACIEEFTISNCYTPYDGAGIASVQGGIVRACTITDNHADGRGGGVSSMAQLTIAQSLIFNNSALDGGGVWCKGTGVFTDTVIANNRALERGGAVCAGIYDYFMISMDHCGVFSNQATWSGGISGRYAGWGAQPVCVVSNTVLAHNRATDFDGGASCVTLLGCTVVSNYARSGGGGAGSSVLRQCRVYRNTTDGDGGGAANCVMDACALWRNHAGIHGGGLAGGVLRNSTVCLNSAGLHGGGLHGETYSYVYATNCIIYYNSAPSDPDGVSDKVVYSCAPVAAGGAGMLTNAPQLASVAHLSIASPCRGAGMALAQMGADIDGDAWQEPPALGCDEPCPTGLTGALTVAIDTADSTLVAGYPGVFVAEICGQPEGHVWLFDEVCLSNTLVFSHAWGVTGSYPVILRASNHSYPDGIAATVTVNVVVAPRHYVDAHAVTSVWPFAAWDTAATSIQQAVDACALDGSQVYVTDGVYQTGGAMTPWGTHTSRVVITKDICLASVNGADATIIVGSGAEAGAYVRGLYLVRGECRGFTISNGHAQSGTMREDLWGGGAYLVNGMLKDCIVRDNVARSQGGGVYGGTCITCRITNNRAYQGGGLYGTLLQNCTITSNSADYRGGGVIASELKNCIVWDNYADEGGNYFNCDLTYSCTAPLPGGHGNICAAPAFVNPTQDNYRVQPISPCINAGTNLPWMLGATDLDGNPRIYDGCVDMGCYEFVPEPGIGGLLLLFTIYNLAETTKRTLNGVRSRCASLTM